MTRRSGRSPRGRPRQCQIERGRVSHRLFVEFAEQVSSTGWLLGSMDSTQPMLSKILSEDRVGDIMEEIRGPAGRTMWDKLDNVNEQVLGNFPKNEYPQTIAVILGKID